MAWTRVGAPDEQPPHIDERWLAKRLAARGLAHDFEAIEYELVGHFTAEVWRARPVDGAAPPLVVKVMRQPPRTGESLDLEAVFYQQIAEKLPVRTPRLVGRIEDGLVLTEVAGLRPFDFEAGPEAGHAQLAMEALAALHAETWDAESDLAWAPSIADGGLRASWQDDFDTVWRVRRRTFDSLCPAFTPIGDALVGRLAATIAPLSAPRVLLHGDAHGENLPMTDDGGIVFLDWESPRVGNPAFDVAVFTTMSFPVRDRRKVEHELVERHLRALGRRSIDWADPWTDYRRAVLRRAARIVELGVQGEPASLAWIFQRCATAAADHHVIDLIV